MAFTSALSRRERNANNFGSYNQELAYSDTPRWIRIYPVYINAKKTRAEGRRISREKAVENPTCQEMFDVLNHAGFSVLLEPNRMYPREPEKDNIHKGRILVQIFNDDKTPVKPEFPNKLSILHFLCISIPKLKSRTRPGPSEVTTKKKR